MLLIIIDVDIYDVGNYCFNVVNFVGKIKSGVIVLGDNIKYFF